MINSTLKYTHKNIVDLRIDQQGFLFNPLKYENNKSNFGIFWANKESNLLLRIIKKNKLYQIILERRNNDSENEEILEIEFDVKDTLKEGEYSNLDEKVKSFGKCTFIFKTKFVKTLIKLWNVRYNVIVNKDAIISQVLDTLLEDCPRSYHLYINNVHVQDFTSFIDCSEDTTTFLDVKLKYVLKSLSGSGEDIILIHQRIYKVIIQALSQNLNADPEYIKLFDINKNLISSKTERITKTYFNADDPADPYCLYYEVNSTKIKCVSIQNTEHFQEIIISVQDTVKDVKEKLKKELGLKDKEIVLFQEDLWLGDHGMIKEAVELQYFVASKLDTIRKGESLGRGGAAEVFKYKVISSNEDLALKQFSIPHDLDMECKDFMKELNILSKLEDHVNIIPFQGLYIEQDTVYLAMEYMSGGTLQEYLSINGPQKEEMIKYFTINMLQGLHFLHKNKIMHRDLKSPNVLLNENQGLKLSDFGLSKLLADKSTNALSKGVTQTADKGTYRWMAPEILNGEKYGVKADVWSLGVIVTEMITGKIPFHEISALDEHRMILRIAETKKIDFDPPSPLSNKLQDFLTESLNPEVSKRSNVLSLLESSFITS